MDCAAPRHDREPEPAETEAWLCRSCRLRLSRHLRRLPALYASLDVTPGRAHGRGRGTGDGLPYDDAISECRSQIRHDLSWWTRQCATDRRQPVSAATVPAMAGYLSGSVRWMVFRSWAGDVAGAMAAVTGQALALLDPWPSSRFPAHAACPDCEAGELMVTIYGEQDKRRSVVECDSCEAAWLPEQWVRLGRRILSGAAA